MFDETLLIYGNSGFGKSTSLRNLPLEETAFINVESKPLPFAGAKKLAKHYLPKNLSEVRANVKEAVEDPKISTIVFDSITMFGDEFLYPELVAGRPDGDTRAGWGDYKDTLSAMLKYCKNSGKRFIFLALAEYVYNKKEMVEKCVPSVQGSMKTKIASHFTYVYFADTKEVEKSEEYPLGVRYVFRTNKTAERADIEAKTPMGLHNSPDFCVDNDINEVLKQIKAFNEGS